MKWLSSMLLCLLLGMTAHAQEPVRVLKFIEFAHGQYSFDLAGTKVKMECVGNTFYLPKATEFPGNCEANMKPQTTYSEVSGDFTLCMPNSVYFTTGIVGGEKRLVLLYFGNRIVHTPQGDAPALSRISTFRVPK